jgi:hypothetical protein
MRAVTSEAVRNDRRNKLLGTIADLAIDENEVPGQMEVAEIPPIAAEATEIQNAHANEYGFVREVIKTPLISQSQRLLCADRPVR